MIGIIESIIRVAKNFTLNLLHHFWANFASVIMSQMLSQIRIPQEVLALSCKPVRRCISVRSASPLPLLHYWFDIQEYAESSKYKLDNLGRLLHDLDLADVVPGYCLNRVHSFIESWNHSSKLFITLSSDAFSCP